MTGAVVVAAAAVVGAGAAVYNAYTSSQVAGQAESQSGTIFSEQQSYERQLQALIADPSSVTSLPGYKFQFEQGTDAVAAKMASGGFLGSTNEATALTTFGQGLASNFYTTQANLLASLAGITAPSSPSQAGAVAASANANSAAQLNSILTDLGIVTALNKGGYFSSGSPGGVSTIPADPTAPPGAGAGG